MGLSDSLRRPEAREPVEDRFLRRTSFFFGFVDDVVFGAEECSVSGLWSRGNPDQHELPEDGFVSLAVVLASALALAASSALRSLSNL